MLVRALSNVIVCDISFFNRLYYFYVDRLYCLFYLEVSQRKLFLFHILQTTSKDELIASITCIGQCIDSLESALTKNRVVIHRRVNPPMLVSISKDLTNDTLRSNAKLLLDHFKEHTLQYFYNAFFPPVTAPDDEVVHKFTIFRSHLEKCESLFDRIMM